MNKLDLGLELEKKLFLQLFPYQIAGRSYDLRLERTWKLIETDYANSDLNLKKAAMIGGANKDHLNVLLRKATGLTFHQLLIRYRILKAMVMMKTQSYSLLEVALQNGFGSFNTFERNFRRLIGMTPKHFRKNEGWSKQI